MSISYDLIVLGSGPGGYVAAIRAAQLGLTVAIVEREALGGICLNWGCIPAKALLRSAEILHYMRNADAFGLAASGVSADLDAVVSRSRRVADQLSRGVAFLMKKHKVAVHMGTGRLLGAGRMAVTAGDGVETELVARDIIVATGARARELPFARFDGQRIWSYREAMTPPEKPSRLLIIGSGAIGVEFASFYADLGVEVVIVEMADRIVPVEDTDISAHLAKVFEKRGISVHTKSSVETLITDANSVRATLRDGDGSTTEEVFSHAILAAGVLPNIEGIGLETLGVAMERDHIVTDGQCRTSVDGVWAIGDVTAPPWLAHKAMHEAVIAAEAIAGERPLPIVVENIPACTFCRPQVASVGLTETAARAAGHDVRVGRFPLIGNGKAIALGEPEGFVKTIFDGATGQLLGAHMIGAEVTELISGYSIGKTGALVAEDLIDTVFPHPTISEAMHEAVLAAYDRTLHL
ncbi:dihydrolipoyl dehydrogenase [Sphingomonas sp. MMS24-J45]|uniref:dihydrolipoyl dehydrogenase n=1 Tax=Sphingomonas sp. MMS24-J45 TaxID=3238806 RepID=UPI00384D3BC4